jgi:hypothetical protein
MPTDCQATLVGRVLPCGLCRHIWLGRMYYLHPEVQIVSQASHQQAHLTALITPIVNITCLISCVVAWIRKVSYFDTVTNSMDQRCSRRTRSGLLVPCVLRNRKIRNHFKSACNMNSANTLKAHFLKKNFYSTMISPKLFLSSRIFSKIFYIPSSHVCYVFCPFYNSQFTTLKY